MDVIDDKIDDNEVSQSEKNNQHSPDIRKEIDHCERG